MMTSMLCGWQCLLFDGNTQKIHLEDGGDIYYPVPVHQKQLSNE